MNAVLQNRKIKHVTLVLLVLVFLFSGAAVFAQNRGAGGGGTENSYIEELIEEIPKRSLSGAEREGLLLMREEEKLARDVYAALYDKWGIRVFDNISRSEESHMESVKLLLDRYGIADPVGRDKEGDFENPVLQKLYDDLVAKGSVSLEAAFAVGAEVEELDIADLKRLISETDNDDLKVVYLNLEKGSRNHLRSFYRQLQQEGADYTPVHISRAEFTSIIRSSGETRGAITDPDYRF